MAEPQVTQSPNVSSLPQETLDFAHRMFDAARNGQTEILLAAVDAGLPVNLTNDQGNTLLMLAAYAGQLPLTRGLIERKADVNAINDRGQTIIAGAVFKGHDDIVKALVEGGADATKGRPNGREAAVIFGRKELWSLLGVPEDDPSSVSTNVGTTDSGV